MSQGRQRFFYVFVLVTGAAVMMLEFAASRLLAPWFGTSIFVWGNIIGAVLIALAAGYYIGGRLADRVPEPQPLFNITLLAGVCIAVIPALIDIVVQPVSVVTSLQQHTVVASIIGSLFVISLVFALPIGLLGMVSPYVIRLATTSVSDAGRVAGALYAWSTVGSIVGTFTSAFIFVPILGSRETIAIAACSLIAVVGYGYRGRRWVLSLLIIPVSLYWLYSVTPWPAEAAVTTLEQEESYYQFIRITDQSDRLALLFNEGAGTQSYFMKTGVLTGSYYDYLALLPFFRPLPEPAQVLVLGLAGGTLTRQYAHFFPTYQLTGVELDPAVIRLAKKYFFLDQQPVTIVTADARQFIQTTDRQFDIIVIDAFTNEYYIPWHLTTREFFEEIQQQLTSGGIVAFNVGSLDDQTRLVQALVATLYEVFPYVGSINVPDSFNYVVLASQQPMSPADLLTVHDERQTVAQAAYTNFQLAKRPSDTVVFTDNRAPIELYTEAMVLEYILGI